MATALFVGSDTTTQGNWVGPYGTDGFFLVGDSPQSSTPAYSTTPSFSGWGTAFVSSSSDARALQNASNHATRNSGIFFTNATATISFTITGTKKVSYYAWSVDGPTSFRVDVVDAATSAVLDSRTVADGFTTPTYLSWHISGSVVLSVVRLTATNGGRFSGLFFDAGSAIISSVSPAGIFPGTTKVVQVAGSLTNFSGGTTTVGISGTNISVGSVSVLSANSLTFSVAALGTASLGARTITVTTGSEVVTASFSVGAKAWRLNATQTLSPWSIAEWRFFDATATEISRSGGTASASSTNANSPSNAFDNNASTFWAGNTNSSLTYQFSSEVAPASFSIQTRSDSGSQVPYDLSVQYAFDGTTWANFYTYLGIPWLGTSGQTITLDAAHAATEVIGISWRISATANGGGSLSLAELGFLDVSAAAIPTGQYAALAPGTIATEVDPGYNAFDGNSTTFWASGTTPSSGSPQTLGYRFSDPTIYPGRFQITPRSGFLNQAPTTFKLQKSTDEVTWLDVQSYTTTWPSGSTQTFIVNSAPPKNQPIIFVAT